MVCNQRWSTAHAACVQCATTRVAHNAGGMCKTCYSRHKWPDRWPSWLAGCLRCGTPTGQANYRRYGLCKPCQRRAEVGGTVTRWRLQFVAQRRGIAPAQFDNLLVRVLAEEITATATARVLGCTTNRVRDYAFCRRAVPKRLRAKLRRLVGIRRAS